MYTHTHIHMHTYRMCVVLLSFGVLAATTFTSLYLQAVQQVSKCSWRCAGKCVFPLCYSSPSLLWVIGYHNKHPLKDIREFACLCLPN